MINGITTLTYKTENVQANQLKELSDQIRDKVKSIAALLLSQTDDKINFVCMVTDDLVEDKQLNAGNIVREVAKVAGGGGGGRPNFATAGGKDISKIDASIEKFKEVLKKF